MKNIIVRKNYTSSDIRSFIKVNEIIILKGDSTHNLLSLKMFNAFKENAKTIKMFITQYDKYGNKIDASYFEYNNLGTNINDFFVPKKYLSLNVNCFDVKIDVVYVEFETVCFKNNKLQVLEKSVTPKEKRKISLKKKILNIPITILAFASLALGCFGYVFYEFIENIRETVLEFKHEDIVYTFKNGNRETNQLVVRRYEGNNEVISISKQLDEFVIVEIEDNAFSGNKVLKEIKIEEGISIGSYVFSGCENLKKAEIENLEVISEGLFSGCTSLEEFDFSSAKSIGNKAFNNTGLKQLIIGDNPTNNLSSSVETLLIGTKAFAQCENLEVVNISKDVTLERECFIDSKVKSLKVKKLEKTISEYFGNGAENLVEISINRLDKIQSSQFAGCINLETVKIDEVVSDIIEEKAFLNCSSLKNLEINKKFKEVKNNAFNNSGIEAFDFSEVEIIGDSAFQSSNIKEINLPKIKSIGNRAFDSLEELNKVTISNQEVVEISGYAFANCTALQEVNIISPLDKISDDMFNECHSLSTISLPNTVTSIEENAFQHCYLIKDLAMPSNLTSIKSAAFLGCESLVSVTIPNTVTALEERAFEDCTKLEHFVLSNSITEIKANLLKGCSNLKEILIPQNITVIGGNAFAGCSSLSNIDLPNSVQTIGSYAFADCSGLTTIVIPDNVTTIEKGIIKGCPKITSLTTPYIGKTLEEEQQRLSYFYDSTSINDYNYLRKIKITKASIIASHAFSNLTNLNEVELPNNLLTIGAFSFLNCSGLSAINIPNTVTAIGDSAFCGCSQIGEIVIPSSVENIGNNVFKQCSSLTSIEIPFIGNSIENNTSLSSLFGVSNTVIPSTLKEVKITRATAIAENTFNGCSHIESIELPTSLTSVGSYAFAYCNSLKTLVIPSNVSTIGEYILDRTDGLETLSIPFIGQDGENLNTSKYLYKSNLPSSLKQIEITNSPQIPSGTFSNCIYLEKVTIGEATTSVGERAFEACSALKNVVLPSNLETIENYTFVDCYKLNEITLPSNVTFIGEGAFYNCTNLVEVELPASLEHLGASAFGYCSALTSVKFNSSLKEIGTRAFDSCVLLKEATLPKGLENIESNLFINCSSLETLSIPFIGSSIEETNTLNYLFDPWWWSVPSSLTKVELTNSTIVASDTFSGCSYIKEIILNEGVESIGSSSFSSCTNLSSITLPSTLKTIENNAFYSCENLSEIELPKGLETIGSYAFCNCFALTSIEIPKDVEELGEAMFANCNNLESAKIPFIGNNKNDTSSRIGFLFGWWSNSGVGDKFKKVEITNSQTIRSETFSWSNIEEVVIGDVTEKIEYSAFYNSKLKKITFGKNVSSIGESCFSECRFLEEIIIPEKVTTIQSNTFYLCEQLKNVTLPENLVTINSYSFYNCRKLEKIVLNKQIMEIGDWAFEGCTSLIEVYNLSDHLMNEWLYPGSPNYGHVAYNALEVFTTLNKHLTKYTYEGFRFAKKDDIWHLIDYIGEDKNVVMPEKIEIENDVIQNYEIKKKLFANTDIESVEIAEGIKYLPEGMFDYCEQLRKVKLPSTLTGISYNAFYGCRRLYEIYNYSDFEFTKGSQDYGYIAESALVIRKDDDTPLERCEQDNLEFYYDPISSEDDTWLVSCNNAGYYDNLVLPNEVIIGEKTIKAYMIHSHAFDGINASKITVSSSVKNIEQQGFQYAWVEEIYFNENLYIENIEPRAFDNTGIRIINLENLKNLKEISDYAFSWSSNLESIVIPEGVTSIGREAFYYCSNLKEITLPSTLETISTYAFYNCNGLSSITLPENLSFIDYWAFEGCSSLLEVINFSSLNIEKNSTENGSVGKYAFLISNSLDNRIVYTSDEKYNYFECEDKWYIQGYENDYTYYRRLILPQTLTINGEEITEYGLTGSLNSRGYLYDLSEIYIPKSVTSIDKVVFINTYYVYKIYYEGTQEDWDKIDIKDETGRISSIINSNGLLFKSDAKCLHDNKHWIYDENGEITTKYTELENVKIEEATCLSEGSKKGTCSLCNKEFTYVISKSSHKVDENGTCSVCGETNIEVVTEFNDKVVNNPSYPYTFKDGKIYSYEASGWFDCDITIYADENMKVSFEYLLAEDKGNIKIIVYQNGMEIFHGRNFGELTLFETTLNKNEKLMIRLTEQNSENSNSGLIISNLMLIYEE